MTVRSVDDALAWAKAQNEHATENWHGLCQKFVRSAYGIGGGFGSAYAQWLGLDDADRHEGGNPNDAPLGAALFYKGSGPYGHIMLAARGNGAWSNDLVRDGQIDYVARTQPTATWAQGYLGWGSSLNGVDLPLQLAKPKPPKAEEHYVTLQRAIQRLGVAQDRAKHFGDTKLADALGQEIRDLSAIEKTARHE